MAKATQGVFYFNIFFDIIDELDTDAEKLEMYEAIRRYSLTGELPEFTSKLVKVGFISIKAIIDKHNENIKNGRTGGRSTISPDDFQPPTVNEVRDYCMERGNSIDPEKFVDYYTANGWQCRTGPLKDWKAAVRGWERNEKKERKAENKSHNNEAAEALADIAKNGLGGVA